MKHILKNNSELNQSDLYNLLSYNSINGDFYWKRPRSNRVKVGDIAGSYSKTTGYIYIGINNKHHAAHRLAFLYMTGNNSLKFIDHINGTKTDNRWINLREVTNQQNTFNCKPHKDSLLQERGLELLPNGNYRVRICKDGERIGLGTYSCIHVAKAVFADKAKELFGEFYCE